MTQTETEVFTELAQSSILTFWVAVLCISGLILFFFYLGWWWVNDRKSPSPYLNAELLPGSALLYASVEKLHAFMNKIHDSDNPFFDLKKAAVCKGTGRVFPNSINRAGNPQVSRDFLQQICPGQWVSWGSLNAKQKEYFYKLYGSLEGFQVKESSREPSPLKAEPYYLALKPGPLLVDLNTKSLIGWQQIEETSLEVLVVKTMKHAIK